MKLKTSLYIDFMRLLAAIAVLIGHAHGYILPIIPNFIAGHADEGVAVFFVLSGFVISFVLAEKEKNWRAFAHARFLRMFSVVPIALIITYVFDTAGRQINTDHYYSISFFNDGYALALLRAITFTNEVWFVSSVFGSNQAYWSLGYEVPYYIAFGLICFLPRKLIAPALVIWVVTVGPRVALFFPLWLLGVLAHMFVRTNSSKLSNSWGVCLLIFSAIIYCVVKFEFREIKLAITYMPPDFFSVILSFLYYLTVGAAVALSIVAINSINCIRFRDRLMPLVPALRWLAGGSFTLYLVHQPMLTFAGALLPDIRTRPAVGAACLFLIIIGCYSLAELGERRRAIYARLLPRAVG